MISPQGYEQRLYGIRVPAAARLDAGPFTAHAIA